MNYTIGDTLIRIKNAYLARKDNVVLAYSKPSLSLAKILAEEKYIKNVKEEEVNGKKQIVAQLLYIDRSPAIMNIKIISKPSLRHYIKKEDISNINKELGIHVLSTNNGMMTHKKAFKKGLGGEVICHVH